MTRRHFLWMPAAALAAAGNRKMTIQLDCGSIGVKASQPESLEMARRHGFESLSADSGWLASQPQAAVGEFLSAMKQHRIVWGNAGMPVQFRNTEEEFRKGMAELPARAAALQRAGVTRVTTWISMPPGSGKSLASSRTTANVSVSNMSAPRHRGRRGVFPSCTQ